MMKSGILLLALAGAVGAQAQEAQVAAERPFVIQGRQLCQPRGVCEGWTALRDAAPDRGGCG